MAIYLHTLILIYILSNYLLYYNSTYHIRLANHTHSWGVITYYTPSLSKTLPSTL